jgi:hypothetical protein
VSVIAEAAAQEHAAPGDPAPEGGSFLDSLVVRLSTEHDVDPQVIRRQRVPGGRGLGRIRAVHQESAVVTG